ncbi:MAG: fibronectin type III domain-containing protein, partial [Lachnospiraceae bacterium]|nr:fibronectin type III domain-containing protein [Lachnospiraceae bacterium]
IVPRPIKSCTFQGPSDARYTGSAVTPIFSINTGYTQLRNGADYTYTVRNNVKPGNAIVTIKGDGKYYIGTTTKVFHIYVAPVSGLTSSGRSGTTAVIRWNRSGTADGYRVTYTSTRGVRKMLITSGSANNYKLTDLGSGSTQVLVEAYVAGSSGQPIAYSTPESIYVR